MAQTIAGDLIDVSEAPPPELEGAVADDGGSQTDETQEANNSTADDMTLLPSSPATGDAYYFGGLSPFDILTLTISTAGDWSGALTWEYYDGAGWVALSNVTDGTNAFQNGGTNDVTYDLPSDWSIQGVNGIEAYWIRARVSSFSSITTQPLGQEAALGGGRTLVAKTRGTITLSPNTNVSESGNHNSLQQDRMATSEAWEVSFEKQLLATLGGLETLGLFDSTNNVLHGRSEDALDRRLTLEIDIQEEDGTTLSTYLIRDGLAILEDANIEEDDFSTASFTLHTHQRPEKTA